MNLISPPRAFTLQYGLHSEPLFRLEALRLRDEQRRPRLIRHERIIPTRMSAVRRDLEHAGVQTTPISVLRHSSGRLYVADGHHRLAALEALGLPSVCARVYPLHHAKPPMIHAAHRIVRSAPAGWLVRYRATVRARFPEASAGSVAICWQDGEERFQCGCSVEALRGLWDAAPLDDRSIDWVISGDAQTARDKIRAGDALAAILVPAVTLNEVIAAADSGLLLPPRSTNFQPKPEENSIAYSLAPDIDACANVAMLS